jgi:tRNA(adenine34) deaminase
MNDENFMKEAIKEAEVALKEGNWPIGCVIVLDDKIIARTHNQVYSKKDKLAHAEMLALQQAKDILHNNKSKAVLYTTYEPCPMCFGASILSRIKRVVCGIDLDNSGAMYFRDHLPLLFKQDKFAVDFKTGVLSDECHKVFIQGEPTKELIKEGLIKKNNSEKLDL